MVGQPQAYSTGWNNHHLVSGRLIPPTPMGTGPLLGSVGAESAQRADRGSARGAILPSFGPDGCVKPYCCLFVYIGFLLRSDGRCQTERESVPGVERAELA